MINFSVYLNKRVFVMKSDGCGCCLILSILFIAAVVKRPFLSIEGHTIPSSIYLVTAASPGYLLCHMKCLNHDPEAALQDFFSYLFCGAVDGTSYVWPT